MGRLHCSVDGKSGLLTLDDRWHAVVVTSTTAGRRVPWTTVLTSTKERVYKKRRVAAPASKPRANPPWRRQLRKPLVATCTRLLPSRFILS